MEEDEEQTESEAKKKKIEEEPKPEPVTETETPKSEKKKKKKKKDDSAIEEEIGELYTSRRQKYFKHNLQLRSAYHMILDQNESTKKFFSHFGSFKVTK